MRTAAYLLTAYNKARQELFEYIGEGADDLIDHTDDKWNGNLKHPQWGDWNEEHKEWVYSGVLGMRSVEKEGLVFIDGYDHTGRHSWRVFSKNLIEHHEED